VTVLCLDLRCRYGRAGGSAGHCNCSSAQESDLALESEHLKQAAMQASKKAAHAQDFALPSIAPQQVAELQASTIDNPGNNRSIVTSAPPSRGCLQELFMRCSPVVGRRLAAISRLGLTHRKQFRKDRNNKKKCIRSRVVRQTPKTGHAQLSHTDFRCRSPQLLPVVFTVQ